jgi:tetratricopeptide (TPR) repeat protein
MSKKHVFVGRKTELDQFRHVIGNPGTLKLLISNPGIGVKSRVFLPFGIGGIGKTELAKQCLKIAREAGWKTISIDWDRMEFRPIESVELMDAIATALQDVAGKNAIKQYINDRNRSKVTRDRVHRYRAEHPEEWKKLLELVGNISSSVSDPGLKFAGGAITTTLDLGPKAMAKAYDLLVDMLVEKRELNSRDAVLFKNPDIHLAHQLVDVIKRAAQNQALVILLDTCEVLSLTLEEFLRDVIVCPAVDQSEAMIFIVSGRFSQYREREVEDSDGNRKRIKGYADRLSDPPPVLWDLSLFADPEVTDYLKESGHQPSEETVSFIQQTARGVPFAVDLIVELLDRVGVERARKEFLPPELEGVNIQEMITRVVRRFLRYCLDNRVDEERLRGLALLRTRDKAALRAVWQLQSEESPRSILEDLEARYGFVQPDGSLHEVVRSFLRDSLRSDDRETALRLGQFASDQYCQSWDEETGKISTLADRLAESRWRRLTLDTLNALCWSDETAAIGFLARRALEALEFYRSLAIGMLDLALEFRGAENWWSSRTGRLYDDITRAIKGEGQEQMSGLDGLLREMDELELDKSQLCLLQIWRSRIFSSQGKFHEAMNSCLEAPEKFLPSDPSIRQVVAKRFGELGDEFGYKNELKNAKLAYGHAVELDPSEPVYHCGYGSTLAATDNKKDSLLQARHSCSVAIELNPEYPWAYTLRGFLNSRLRDYSSAVQDLERAIELDSENPITFYRMACIYAAQDKVEQVCHYLLLAISKNEEFIEMAREESAFDPIRNKSEFKELMGSFAGK